MLDLQSTEKRESSPTVTSLKVNDIVKHYNPGLYPYYGIVRRISYGVERPISVHNTFADVGYTYPGGGGMTLSTVAYHFTVVGDINELVTLADPEKD